MSDLAQGTGAARAAADALLRGCGGRVVLLRIPTPATPGDATEQLGLATPGFQDVELAPVAFRKARARGAVGEAPRYELMVSATAVEALVGSVGYGSVAVLFGAAAGVLVDGAVMFIESCNSSDAGGVAYCYRLGLRGALAVVV